MLAPSDILRLARLYSAAEGIALSTLGKRACRNNKVFRRLAAGAGANTRTLAQIETFLRASWPENACWPVDLTPGPLSRHRGHRVEEPCNP